MANVRSLKKDVNYITSELIIECLTFDYLFPDKNKEELTNIITDVVTFRNNTIEAINKAPRTSSEPVKNHFKNIRLKMNSEIDQIIDRLKGLSK